MKFKRLVLMQVIDENFFFQKVSLIWDNTLVHSLMFPLWNRNALFILTFKSPWDVSRWQEVQGSLSFYSCWPVIQQFRILDVAFLTRSCIDIKPLYEMKGHFLWYVLFIYSLWALKCFFKMGVRGWSLKFVSLFKSLMPLYPFLSGVLQWTAPCQSHSIVFLASSK